VERIRAYLGLAAIAAVLATAPVAAATGTTKDSGVRHTVTALPSLNASILVRLNAVRASRGLRRLTVSTGLAAAARLHSREMAVSGLFQHESPDGTPFFRRVRRFYGPNGYRSWSIGETLVYEPSTATAADIVTAWLDSPPHRQILLDPSWHEIGISAVLDTGATGDFAGQDSTIVTADFGVRDR
jgi:uncharacterized protein YkwD